MERRGVGEASLAHKQRRQAAALHMRGGIRRARAMDLITPRICAGYDISCPYETGGGGRGRAMDLIAPRICAGHPPRRTVPLRNRRWRAREGDGFDRAEELRGRSKQRPYRKRHAARRAYAITRRGDFAGATATGNGLAGRGVSR